MNLILIREVNRFVVSLEKPTIGKWLRHLDLLEMYGESLGMPHVRRIGNGLFELRIRGIQEVRTLFVFRNDNVIILHVFIKKTQKIPQKEIMIASNRLRSLTGL